LDEKGRLLLPQHMIEAAGLSRDVLAVGVDRAVELWNPDRYFALEKQQRVDVKSVERILF
jgi:DNA-binding transcriptional regulator/RsmH inhibitor MraZ